MPGHCPLSHSERQNGYFWPPLFLSATDPSAGGITVWPKPTAGLGFAKLWLVLRPGLPVSVHLWDEAAAPSPPREPGWSGLTLFACFWLSVFLHVSVIAIVRSSSPSLNSVKDMFPYFSFLLFHIRQRSPLTTSLPEVSQKIYKWKFTGPVRLLGMNCNNCLICLIASWMTNLG